MFHSKNLTFYFGCLLIIINISMFNTVLPSLLFGGGHAWYIDQTIILMLNVIYIFLNGLSVPRYVFYVFKDSSVRYLYMILLFIYFFETIRYLVNPYGSNLILIFLNFLAFISFSVLLLKVLNLGIKIKGSFAKSSVFILKVYSFFCFLIVICSVLVFILLLLRLIKPDDYLIPHGFNIYIDNDSSLFNVNYTSPLYVSVLINNSIRSVPFFGQFGIFCGISHEPHIADLLVTPSYFLLMGLEKKQINKVIITILYVSFFLMTSSATNLIIFPFVLCFGLIIDTIQTKKWVRLAFILVLLSFLIITFFDIYEGLLRFISQKLDSSSALYSQNFLSYIVSPTNFWGYGLFNVPYPGSKFDDIGILFSILIVLLFFSVIVGSLRLSIKKGICHYGGLAILYFILHSLKIPQLIIIYPFTAFIFFIMGLLFVTPLHKNNRDLV